MNRSVDRGFRSSQNEIYGGPGGEEMRASQYSKNSGNTASLQTLSYGAPRSMPRHGGNREFWNVG